MKDDKDINGKQNKPRNASLLQWKRKIMNQQQKKQFQSIIVLANGQGMYKSQCTYKFLLQKYIYSKMTGVNSSSKNIAQFVAQPFLIDKYSCAYSIAMNLVQMNKQLSSKDGIKQIKEIMRSPLYGAYKYLLQKKSFYLIDGHKFGGDFLAYELNPDSNHATFLVFVNPHQKRLQMQHISRLAGVCKKKGLLLVVQLRNQQQFQITQQQIQPRLIQNKKNYSIQNTRQLQQLKRFLGYQM